MPALGHAGGHQGGCDGLQVLRNDYKRTLPKADFPEALNWGYVVSLFASDDNGHGVKEEVEFDHTLCG